MTKNRPNVLVSALILVNREGRVLLAQRPLGKSMAGLWEFPGGKVKEGEELKAALIREIKEELGVLLAARDLEKALTITHDYPDFHLEMPMFLCRRWQGEIKPLEGQALAWVLPKDLSDYPMPPADQPLISKLPALLREF